MSEVASNAPHLRGLNAAQRRAVLHTTGPILVLAGAGSGKTKMLVHRIVHLIRGDGVDPGSIVAVTFTNRAAEEMRERVRSYAGEDARRVVVSTFHSLGVRILRTHAARLGLPARFAIYAGADQLAALRRACAEISIDDDRFDLHRVLRRVSDWKSRRVTPAAAVEEVRAGRTLGTRADDYAVLAAGAYARYEEVLRASGAVDFDDLLLLPVRLLEEHEEVRHEVWRRWHHVLVDEYQDTNGVQLDFARLLAGARRNLCVVGDDDQSIYAFRGADVGNILEFERHFPGAAVVKLEENYRSTRRILGAANAVIAQNPHRHEKRLRTENPVGALIDYYEHEDDAAEAEAVAKEIQIRRFRNQLRWGDFAVLYRANTQARPLEEALRAENVPYRVIGGTSFFDRKEVADGIAYLRVAGNAQDEIALRRIINYPTRGIGRTTVLRLAELAQARGTTFARALHDAAEEVGAAQAKAIGRFLREMAEARAELAEAERQATKPPFGAARPPLAAWAESLFERFGLEDAIRAEAREPAAAEPRLSNLRDLAGAIARYERKVWAASPELTSEEVARLGAGADVEAGEAAADWRPPSLTDALARIALVGLEEDEEDARDEDATVALMTLHSAKGLEFPDVFLIGLEEGLLPHARSIEAAADPDAAAPTDALAEERRLLYVGITRARQRLTLSLCRQRRRGGELVDVLPSRFLEAIPAELLNVKTAERILTEEESKDLRENFFSNMRAMLGDG